VRALVLEAPFTSVVDVGRLTWGVLPLRFVMVDQHRTIDHIAGVRAPLFIVHGARDTVIPVAQARRLYAKANEPKTLVILREGEHNDLFHCGAWEKIRGFLEGVVPAEITAGKSPMTEEGIPDRRPKEELRELGD
jgi:uncharacterized protein